jgi:hypothetical protein
VVSIEKLGKVKFRLPLVLSAAFGLFIILGSIKSVPGSWIDEFSSQEPRWEWEYLQEQKKVEMQLVSVPGAVDAVEILIKGSSTSSEYSDGSLHERYKTIYSGTFETRLRLSDDNGLTGIGKGTRGWGFWSADVNQMDAAWFWSASEESSDLVEGLRAMVIRNGVILLNKQINVDMREWHDYRIELTSNGVKFYVDGQFVASTPGRPANQQRIELWVDNMAVHVDGASYTTEYLNLDTDQKMFIDWVRFTPVNGSYIYIPILLR